MKCTVHSISNFDMYKTLSGLELQTKSADVLLEYSKYFYIMWRNACECDHECVWVYADVLFQ